MRDDDQRAISETVRSLDALLDRAAIAVEHQHPLAQAAEPFWSPRE
jgi:hypothetical protein